MKKKSNKKKEIIKNIFLVLAIIVIIAIPICLYIINTIHKDSRITNDMAEKMKMGDI